MKKIKKSILIYFFVSLTLSVGLPLGILGIIFGALKHNYFLLTMGIIFVVAGFYVMPIMWVKYAERKQYKTLLFMIENENLLTVEELSSQTNYPSEKVNQMINFLIMKNYLVGYIFNNGKLEPNLKKNDNMHKVMKKCSNCGAVMKLEGDKYICEYCNSYLHK